MSGFIPPCSQNRAIQPGLDFEIHPKNISLFYWATCWFQPRKNMKQKGFIFFRGENVRNVWNQQLLIYMGVSKNRGTPKSWILMGFSIINHPFWRFFPLFLETPIYLVFKSPYDFRCLWISSTSSRISNHTLHFPPKSVGPVRLGQPTVVRSLAKGSWAKMTFKTLWEMIKMPARVDRPGVSNKTVTTKSLSHCRPWF